MFEMIRYEWKKIGKSLLVKFVMTGVGFIFLLSFVSGIAQQEAVDYQGREYRGLSAIRVFRETQLPRELSQERVDKLVGQYLEYRNNPETSSDAHWYDYLSEDVYRSFYLPNRELFYMIYNAYAEWGSNESTLDVFEKNYKKDFRKAQIETRGKVIKDYTESGIITEQQAAYWNKKADAITGCSYGYCGGWREILYMGDCLILIMMLACISAAPVFAGEYQSKCDSLFLCMKHGKGKLVTAKIMTAVLFATVVYWAIMLAYSLACLLVYGMEGADLPIQMQNPTTMIPYDMTMAQGVVLFLVLGYVLTLGMVGITLLFSALLKNPFYVIVVAFLLILAPIIAQMLELGYIFRHIVKLFPSTIIFFTYASYEAYSIGKIVASWPTASMIVNMAGTVIFALLSRAIFKRHEVNR